MLILNFFFFYKIYEWYVFIFFMIWLIIKISCDFVIVIILNFKYTYELSICTIKINKQIK